MSKGLKALKQIGDAYVNLPYCVEYLTIKNELKALEIIKEKEVNVRYLLSCDDYEEYLDDFNDRQGEGNLPSFKLLTREEFDLLKEVLTNDK